MNKFALICFTAAVLPAADSGALGEDRVRIDIGADKRSGRLVRRVTVEPTVIQAKPVTRTASKAPLPSLPLSKNPRIDDAVERAARQYDVDPLLVHAVIQVESAYNPYAISPVGAQGLMQLMPGTARQLGVRNSFDVEENIRAGVKHLKDLQQQYKDDRLALAAYNAGAGAVNKYRWIPPYQETQEYVYKVGRKYGEARRAASAQPAQPAKPETAKSEPVPVAKVEPAEPQPRGVEAFVDAEGRLHMRTK